MTYLITFACYGCHLHGDPEGSVDRKHNQPGSPLVEPSPKRVSVERRLMNQPPYRLDAQRRQALLDSIVDGCSHCGRKRRWAGEDYE